MNHYNSQDGYEYIETFKPVFIEGEKTKYIISDVGTVINTKRNKEVKAFLSKRDNRYGLVLCHKNVHYKKSLARWIALAHIDIPEELQNIDTRLEVDHKDNNSLNDWVDNLQWISQENNLQKRDEYYGTSKGVDNPACTITEDDVHNICKLLEDNMSPSKISKKIFGTDKKRCTINNIKHRRQWTHISQNYNF